jgi:poly-gamma-glutamate synthesis protein (capsule biosynthesis protein)
MRWFILFGLIILFLAVTVFGVVIAVRVPDEDPVRETLSLSFLGDIMAHDVNYSRAPYNFIWEGVAEVLQTDDLSFGNLEFPIDPRLPMSNYPRFNVHPSYVDAAIEAGVDIFSLANNHTTDQGADSVRQTSKVMEKFQAEKGIRFSGIRTNQFDGFIVEEIEYGGWKIGFLAVTAFVNLAKGKELVYLVNYRNDNVKQDLLDMVRNHSSRYDLFILSFHDGIEYALEPHKDKAEFLRELARNGADIIWAHHPHVLQPWEALEHDGKTSLILMSNGNFISGQTWTLNPAEKDPLRADTGESAIFRVIVRKTENGSTLESVDPYLIVNYRHPEHGMVVLSYENLEAASIPQVWKDYYQKRLPDLRELMEGVSVLSGE